MKGKITVIKNGLVVARQTNKLTDTYRNLICTFLSGASVTAPSHIGIGTGVTAASALDSRLITEIARAAKASGFVRGLYSTRISAGFGVLNPPYQNYSIREIGLFNQGPILVANGDFETWVSGLPTGWTATGLAVVAESTEVFNGSKSAKLTTTAVDQALSNTIDWLAAYQGKEITMLVAVKADAVGAIAITISDGVSTTESSVNTTTGWELIRISKILSTNATTLPIQFKSKLTGTHVVYVDWVTLNISQGLLARTVLSSAVVKAVNDILNVIWEITPESEAGEIEAVYSAFAKETISVDSSLAKALTLATYAPQGQTPAQQAFVYVESQNIRFWIDGSDPTATSGHLVSASSDITLEHTHDIQKFRAIAVTGTANLSVTYLR